MKQETLEEAYNRIFEYKLDRVLKVGFIAGANWQQEQHNITIDDAYNEGFENGKHFEQERSYSEEEVFELLENLVETFNPPTDNLKKWFEQFKK